MAQDNLALREGIQSGTIKTIGSDHCSFTKTQKDLGKDASTKIPNGVPGTETTISLMYSEGVRKGRIDLLDFVKVAYYKRCVNISSDADLVLIDPQKSEAHHRQSAHQNRL